MPERTGDKKLVERGSKRELPAASSLPATIWIDRSTTRLLFGPISKVISSHWTKLPSPAMEVLWTSKHTWRQSIQECSLSEGRHGIPSKDQMPSVLSFSC